MAKIKVSDYVARFIAEQGVRDVFLISGGGMMHLLDGATKNEDLNLVFNLNEQASGICAESYGQFTNKLGVCMVTTGPGGTNAVTGCAAAWTDSTPVLFISGQTKTADMGQLKGLRQFGAQEIAIVPIVRPITKYAEIVLEKNDIAYCLEKAVYLATSARRGPVWVDIPLDIQAAVVEETELKRFNASLEGCVDAGEAPCLEIEQIDTLIKNSKRPVVLFGHGVVAANAGSELKRFIGQNKIPALATWRAKDVLEDDFPYYYGMPGIPAPRYANNVLQNADLLLIIGTRLNPALTAYDEANFAPGAKKIIVDVDRAEIEKLEMPFEHKINADAKVFLDLLLQREQTIADRSEWLRFCDEQREKYRIEREKQPYDNEGKVDGYFFAQELSRLSDPKDILIGSASGRTCGITHMAYSVKEGQRFISSMGLGSMGWGLPSAIACCFASNKSRTLVLEGDGSLQHNIQELALINTYGLPIKLFIWSNEGYASIYAMQRNNFESRFSGCSRESGLEFPDLKKIAEAYGIAYQKITKNEEVAATLKLLMQNDEPVICEVVGSINFDEIPKSMTVVKPDGTFESSKLENLYPVLSEDEQFTNMPDWESRN